MLRLIFRISQGADAARIKSFDVDLPEVEKFLNEVGPDEMRKIISAEPRNGRVARDYKLSCYIVRQAIDIAREILRKGVALKSIRSMAKKVGEAEDLLRDAYYELDPGDRGRALAERMFGIAAQPKDKK